MDTKPTATEPTLDITAIVTEREPFQHQPLDYSAASIRLLRIRPDSSRDGLIQCSLIHAAISDTTYSCLSYRWGEPLPSSKILINGRAHWVGQNLYDFLDVFRQTALNEASEHIWIDALCIAQDNILERNHQVTQMGEIFSTARTFYVWLGKMPSITPIVKSLKNWQDPTYEDIGIVRSEILSEYLYKNQYWNRAWITQEFLQACSAVVFLDSEPMEILEILNSMRSFYLLQNSSFSSSSFKQHVIHKYVDTMAISGLPLVSLMGHFRDKRCALIQDRAFSLLSLCSPSSRVPVDYDQNAATLACKVLAKSPEPLCLCEIMTVLRELEIVENPTTKHQDHEDSDHREWEGFYVDVDLHGAQLAQKLLPPGYLVGEFFLLYDGEICPVIERLVASCAQDTFESSSAFDKGMELPCAAENIPFLYRNLRFDTAQRLSQCNDMFTVKASNPRSSHYTLRFTLHALLKHASELRIHCLSHHRGATWRYGSIVSPGSENDDPSTYQQEQWSKYPELAKNLSFEMGYSIYRWTVIRRDLYPWWGIGDVFENLVQHFDEDKETSLESSFKDAIPGIQTPLSYCGWGPCRFVCPEHYTKKQAECDLEDAP